MNLATHHAATRHKLHVAGALQRGDPVPAAVLRDYPDLASPTLAAGDLARAAGIARHKLAVIEALMRGDQVPAAVLQDYPELAPAPDAFAELQAEARAAMGSRKVRESLPFLMVVEVRDSRLCPKCFAIARSGLQGTGIFSVEDPAIPTLPVHPNCRCVPILLTLERAAARGIRVAQRWLETGVRPRDAELFVTSAAIPAA